MIDLDERGQADLVMTLLRLVVAERMVDRGHRWHDIQLLSHRRLLVVDEDEDSDLARANDRTT